MLVLCIFFLLLSGVFEVCGHGFAYTTLVKMGHTYNHGDLQQESVIESWQTIGGLYDAPKDSATKVRSYAPDSAIASCESITKIGKGHANCSIKIHFIAHRSSRVSVNSIICSPTQEFFVVEAQQWMPACRIVPGDTLLCANALNVTVIDVALIKEPIELYMLEVENTHTFFVSASAILTHNIPLPVGLVASVAIPFGEGAIAGSAAGGFFGPVTLGIGLLGGGILSATYFLMTKDASKAKYNIALDVDALEAHLRGQFNRARSGSNQQSKNNAYNVPYFNPEGPDDEGEKCRRTGNSYTTNKQDTEDAEKLGYKRDKHPPFNPHNKLTFKKGQRWISPDRDSHKGGRWKMFDKGGKRLGTFDENLRRIIGD